MTLERRSTYMILKMLVKLRLRPLLLKITNGVESEKFKLCSEVLKGAEGECSALKDENRKLKTKVKELALKVNKPKQ